MQQQAVAAAGGTVPFKVLLLSKNCPEHRILKSADDEGQSLAKGPSATTRSEGETGKHGRSEAGAAVTSPAAPVGQRVKTTSFTLCTVLLSSKLKGPMSIPKLCLNRICSSSPLSIADICLYA